MNGRKTYGNLQYFDQKIGIYSFFSFVWNSVVCIVIYRARSILALYISLKSS